jgi:SAM-dependent methyltransferase
MTVSANPPGAATRPALAGAPRLAFGVDPSRPERYSLRQARYAALAEDIDGWAAAAAGHGQRLSLLDVGCGWGPLLCHLAGKPHFAGIDIAGADMIDMRAHGRDRYADFFVGDLRGGYPEIGSDRYDLVVCEQVLEHLDALDAALATLVRMTRPGGRLVVGVPIFVPPLHLARRYLVPPLARLLRHPDSASHQQAFSLASFRRRLRAQPRLAVERVRGFRILSGGLLRPLENHRWWWRLNRRLGELLPAACIEVQIIAHKKEP